MEFRVFGPIELWVGEQHVPLGPLKQRTLLASLLVDPGRPVMPEVLIGRVWDDAPPAAVRSVVYTYVTRVRRILEGAERASGMKASLRRQSGGYLLDVDPDLIDLHRFRRLVEQARCAANPDSQARLLRLAVRLRRDAVLADLSGAWATRVREALDRQYLDALVELAEAELRMNRPHLVINELREAIVERPLAESLISELLRALCHAGRTVEALEYYAKARQRIVDEIGAEPGPALRYLHESILKETYSFP
ncbi:BTAD domain-containing putative transcriptional regulator [Actinomycetes bacterium KLBMP 9797]